MARDTGKNAIKDGSSLRISVVICLYNKAPFIRGTLQSVLKQSYPPAEIIIVDDGSTDESVQRIADLFTENVRLVRQPNSGPGPARNRGFSEAACDWVALLDADDLWLPDHLSTMARLISDFPLARVIATSFERISSGYQGPVTSAGMGEVEGHLLEYFKEAGVREPIWSSAVAIHRETFRMSSGFKAFWPGEDVELWARLALDYPVAATRKVTALYRVATGGLMDQGKDHRFAPGEEPEFRVLEAALADPTYTRLHSDLRGYRRRLLVQRVRQSLYLTDQARARAFLRLLNDNREGGLAGYRLLSLAPVWLLRFILYCNRRIRSLRAEGAGSRKREGLH